MRTLHKHWFEWLKGQGSTSVLAGLVRDHEGLSLMLDRAENLLHDWFGDADYWAARRSMHGSAIPTATTSNHKTVATEQQ